MLTQDNTTAQNLADPAILAGAVSDVLPEVQPAAGNLETAIATGLPGLDSVDTAVVAKTNDADLTANTPDTVSQLADVLVNTELSPTTAPKAWEGFIDPNAAGAEADEAVPANVSHEVTSADAVVREARQNNPGRAKNHPKGEGKPKKDFNGNKGEGKQHPKGQPQKAKQEHKDRPARPRQEIIAEGFVRVIKAKGSVAGDDAVRFVGLIVEGKSKAGGIRNRFIVPDNRCDEWFKKLCVNIASGLSHMRVRVKVIRLFDEHLCFAQPSARSLEQAEQEWARQLMENSRRPKRIEDTDDDVVVAEIAYRRASEIAKLDFISFHKDESGKNRHYALAVDDRSNIIRLTGFDNFVDFVEGIRKGATTMDKEIEYNIVYDEVR